MREQFEKLPEIAHLIEEGKGGNLIFIPETNKYNAEMYITFTPDYVHYLNGAWYAYQEQQKKIDAVRSWAKYHIEDFNLQESNSDHDRGWYNASCQVFININNMCGD